MSAHIYVESSKPNKCLFCGESPEAHDLRWEEQIEEEERHEEELAQGQFGVGA